MTHHIIRGAISNLAARLLGLAASFLNVYLLGRLLNSNDFGLWIWLFAIFSLITAQDFGYISAMRVRMGQDIAKGHPKAVSVIYVSALFLTLIIISLLAGGIPLYDVWSGHASDEKNYRNLAIICSAFTLLGTVSAQALIATLRTTVVSAIEAFRSLAQIIIYLLAYVMDLSVGAVVYIFFLTTLLYVPLVTKVYWQSANISLYDIVHIIRLHYLQVQKASKSILKDGALLWGGQIGITMLVNSDVYLAGYFMPDSEVAKIGVISRFQLLGVGLFAAALMPLSANFVVQIGSLAKTLVMNKIRQALVLFTLAGLLYIFVTYAWGSELIMRWSTIEIDNKNAFLLSGMLFTLMLCVTLLQMFMQFTVFAGAMVLWLLLMVIVKIGLTASFVSSFGYLGVFGASIIASAVFLAIALVWLARYGGFERIVAGKARNE